MRDLLESIEGIPDEARAKLLASWDETATKLDTATAQAREAAKALKAAEARAAKISGDLETSTKDRDAQLAAYAEAKTKAEAAAADAAARLRSRDIRDGLRAKLTAVKVTDPTMQADALALLGIPDGVDLDESGALVGADKLVADFVAARPHFTAAPARSVGGAPGARPPGTPPEPAKDAATQRTEGFIARWNARHKRGAKETT